MTLENRINNEVIEIFFEKGEVIKNICKSQYVKSLFVFGSILRQDFNAESDIDFLYEIDFEKFENWDLGDYDYTDNLLSFESSLHHLLHRKIDLINNITIQNKYLRQEIEKTKVHIYVA